MSSKSNKSGRRAAALQAKSDAEATAEVRRQFNATQKNIQPFVSAGAAQLPGLQESATVGGLEETLGQIFGSEQFQNLRDERTTALEGQLAAGGLTRSGTALDEAAAIPTELGFSLEQLLNSRSSNLAGQGQNAANSLGQFGAQSSGQIAGITQSTGRARASGRLADDQANAKAKSDNLKTAVSIGASFFSDPSLKDNMEQIGEARDLALYQWDWKPETEGTMIADCGTIGFMATEVQEKYPQHVYEFSGFLVIDYPELLKELEERNAIDQSKLEETVTCLH
jgi:hypothetical protein